MSSILVSGRNPMLARTLSDSTQRFKGADSPAFIVKGGPVWVWERSLLGVSGKWPTTVAQMVTHVGRKISRDLDQRHLRVGLKI
jgi:hypothetical protein